MDFLLSFCCASQVYNLTNHKTGQEVTAMQYFVKID